MGDGLPVVTDRAHPEHEVGEGEVGDELPVADEQVQPVDVVVGQIGPPAQELAEGGHDPSLCVAADPLADRSGVGQCDVTTVVDAAATHV